MDFEVIWREYPKRPGGQDKNGAFRAWSTRRREGVSAETLLEGVRRYAKYILVTGKSNTEFIKLAKTFFNASEHFNEDWKLPKQITKDRSDFGKMSAPDNTIPSGFRG